MPIFSNSYLCVSTFALRDSRVIVINSMVFRWTIEMSLIGGFPLRVVITLVISASGFPRVFPLLVKYCLLLTLFLISKTNRAVNWYSSHLVTSVSASRLELHRKDCNQVRVSRRSVLYFLFTWPFVFLYFRDILISNYKVIHERIILLILLFTLKLVFSLNLRSRIIGPSKYNKNYNFNNIYKTKIIES